MFILVLSLKVKLNPCQWDQFCLSCSLEMGWKEQEREGGRHGSRGYLGQPRGSTSSHHTWQGTQLVVRRNSWRQCLQQPLKGQFLHGNIFTHVNKKPQSDKSHIIKIIVWTSWVVLEVKRICFWVKKFHLFLGGKKSIHMDFEHFS